MRVCTAVSVNEAAPAARPAPREREGPEGHENEDYLKHPEGVTSNNHSDHNQKGETYVSHDHEDATSDPPRSPP